MTIWRIFGGMPVAEETVEGLTRGVATGLLPQLPSIGEGMTAYIASAMPELVEREALELVRASCHANCSMLVDGLIRSVPLESMAPSSEVIQTTRALVRRGIAVSDVVRGYQLGTSYFSRRWTEAVEADCQGSPLAVATVSGGTSFLLAWLERVVDRLTVEYREEAERLAREGSFARAADVRRVLADADVDVLGMSQRLAYDLRGAHVALVVSRRAGEDETPLETVARELAAGLTSARPLVVRVDVDTAWCWVPTRATDALPGTRAGVLVGQGRPASGLDGFRKSHAEAVQALRVAALAGGQAGSVSRFEDVELAALCTGDVAACGAFLRSELGPLAPDTSDAALLRETLRAFFESSSNFRATAAKLGIHHNTVRYRLDKAERLLERPIGMRRLQLELALHLAARVGAIADES